MRKLATLLIPLALSACSFQQTIAEHSVGYNETVAQSADAQILLNILRARDRHPMHFTAVSGLTGVLSQSSSSSLGFTIPFGGDAPANFTFTPQLNLTQESKPTFNVAVLDTTEEFVNAILTPIRLEDVKFFLDQGWPTDLIVYLVVESGEIREPKNDSKNKSKNDSQSNSESDSKSDSQNETFTNRLGGACKGVGKKVENDPANNPKKDPKKEINRLCFSAIVKHLKKKLRIVKSFSGTRIGPLLDAEDLTDVKRLVKIKDMGLSLVPIETQISKTENTNENKTETRTQYQLCEIKTRTQFCVEDDCKPKDKKAACQRESEDDEPPDSGVASLSFRPFPKDDKTRKDDGEKTNEEKKEDRYAAHLRSLQGMLYFAGELIRNQAYQSRIMVEAGVNYDPIECKSESTAAQMPLFKVEMGDPPSNAAVVVSHQGEQYWIPSGDKCSRSLAVLSFLTQVKGLYQSRAEIPASQPIISIER